MQYVKFMGSFIAVITFYFVLIYVHNNHISNAVILPDGPYNIQSIG